AGYWHGPIVRSERGEDDARRPERPAGQDERGGLVRLLLAGVGARRADPHASLVLAEGADEAAVEIREVRGALELLERPLRPVDAPGPHRSAAGARRARGPCRAARHR